jgi:hypothetical protein
MSARAKCSTLAKLGDLQAHLPGTFLQYVDALRFGDLERWLHEIEPATQLW